MVQKHLQVIGIDLGATRVKAGRVSEEGKVLDRRIEIVVGHGAEDAIVALLAKVVGELTTPEVCGVGLAAAGVHERALGIIRESPNFPSWRNFAIGQRLSEACSLPVVLENDANAAILGEARAGAGRGVRHVVGVTLGTGVGGGIVLDGRLWRGARGMAGELGHVTVEREGRACGCGNRGCLEQYAGAVGLRKSAAELGGRWTKLSESHDLPRLLAEAAMEGDEGALAIWHDVGRYVGQAFATFIHALDVQLGLVCGGVAHSAPLFMPHAEAELAARTFASMRQGVRLRVGDLDEDAGIVGAAASALDEVVWGRS